MIRRVRVDTSDGGSAAWAVCFRVRGEPTDRTLMHVLRDADRPELETYSDEVLLEMLAPLASARDELEARRRAEAEELKAATRAANAAAKAAKAEALSANARARAADPA